MDENKIIHTALHKYGAAKQRAKCVEELSELIKEICKDIIGEGNNVHVAEEIADCEIMIAQMKVYYGAEKLVEMLRRQKLLRLSEKVLPAVREESR